MSPASSWQQASARHVQVYALAWLGYFAMLTLLPVRYGSLEKFPAIASMLLWVGLSVLTAIVIHRMTAVRAFTRTELMSAGRPMRVAELERLVWLSIWMALAGFVCLCYDRIVLQGIDFTKGIAVARQLWRRAGEDRDGVSSIFSVLGYLLGFSFFVTTTLGHLHWEVIQRGTRRAVIFSAALLVAANSLLTGGRSIVLVQLASIVAVGSMRALLGLKMMPGRGARIWLGGAFTLIVAIGYSLYVFSARAEAGKTLPEKYATGVIAYLGGEPTAGFYDLNVLPAPVAATSQFATVAGAYLTHSYGSFESVLQMEPTTGSVSFGFVRELFAKMGIGQVDTADWLLTGRFLSVPGALWYDFGWVGFYAGAIVIGLMFGLAPRVLAVRNGAGLSLVFVLFTVITGLLSPLVLSIDILSTPFLLLGFVQVDLFNRLMRGPGNWLYVSRAVRRGYLE